VLRVPGEPTVPINFSAGRVFRHAGTDVSNCLDGQPQYRSLDPTKLEIRVLAILLSFKKLSTIKRKLVKVDLNLIDEAPFGFYEALSYTWGDATLTESIILNSHVFQVTGILPPPYDSYEVELGSGTYGSMRSAYISIDSKRNAAET
jgi:hypothetical protein